MHPKLCGRHSTKDIDDTHYCSHPGNSDPTSWHGRMRRLPRLAAHYHMVACAADNLAVCEPHRSTARAAGLTSVQRLAAGEDINQAEFTKIAQRLPMWAHIASENCFVWPCTHRWRIHTTATGCTRTGPRTVCHVRNGHKSKSLRLA